MNIREYVAWIATDREKIAVKKMLVDIAGDLIAGIVLSQIEYWHLPSKGTGKSRLRAEHDGQKWLVKRATDWREECRISGKQATRALAILEAKQLIVTGLWKYNGAPTTFIRINWPVYLAAVDAEISKRVNSIFTDGQNPFAAEGEIDLDENGNSLTVTTTVTTSDNAEEEDEEKKSRPQNLVFNALYWAHTGEEYISKVTKIPSKMLGMLNAQTKVINEVDGTAEDVRDYFQPIRDKQWTPTRNLGTLQTEIKKRVDARRMRGEQAAAMLDNESQVFEDYDRMFGDPS